MNIKALFFGFALLAGLVGAGCQSEQTTPDEVKAASSQIVPSAGQGDPPPDMPKKGPKSGAGPS